MLSQQDADRKCPGSRVETLWRQSTGLWENADQHGPGITPESQQCEPWYNTWAFVWTWTPHSVRALLWATGSLLNSNWGACSWSGSEERLLKQTPIPAGLVAGTGRGTAADPTQVVPVATESLSQAPSKGAIPLVKTQMYFTKQVCHNAEATPLSDQLSRTGFTDIVVLLKNFEVHEKIWEQQENISR